MIINNNVDYYNPLVTIFPIIDKELSLAELDFIRAELFCGGIVAETEEEFNQLISLLRELKKEKYGKE